MKSGASSSELDAAIFAAAKFAGASESFSANVCHKIAEMVGGHSTPLEMKIKLISVFQVQCSLPETNREAAWSRESVGKKKKEIYGFGLTAALVFCRPVLIWLLCYQWPCD